MAMWVRPLEWYVHMDMVKNHHFYSAMHVLSQASGERFTAPCRRHEHSMMHFSNKLMVTSTSCGDNCNSAMSFLPSEVTTT